MQLIAIPRFRFNSTVFNPSLSAVLSGMTAVGAISAAIYHFDSARNKIGSSLISLLDTEATKYLLSGLSKVGDKFYNWGSSIVGSKDAFKQWLSSYFNASGLKAGTVKLYEKLRDWTLIVYTWFRDKFWTFITNIPEMVRKWDQLRLSLFKWGTFLGGGGGAALWAMFGSGADLSKLGDLMNHPNFGDMMERFGELFNDNKEAFDKLGAEGIQEILEEYLNDPEKADKAAQELMKEQKERKDKAEQKAEEKPEEIQKEPEPLSAEEIMEKFKPSQAGNPPNKAAVLSDLINGGLKGLLEKPISGWFFDEPYYARARKAMDKFLKKIEADVEKRPNSSKIKSEFLAIIKEKREVFLDWLSKAADKAFQWFEPQEKDKVAEKDLQRLRDRFIEAITTKAPEGQEGDAGPLVKALKNE